MIFSDVHLHPWKYGATTLENGYNSRLWAQGGALDLVFETCLEEEIEYAYFCGDMFHTPGTIPTQALATAQDFFRKMKESGIKLRMLVGNHDMGNRAGNIHALGHYAVKPGEFKTWQDGSLLVHGLGYTTDEDQLRKFLEYGAEYGGMLLMHQGVAGVPLSSGYILDEKLTGDLIPENCVAFTGHYHNHTRVNERLTVVGNLTALNWNDLDQRKGFIVYDDETGEMSWRSSESSEFVTYDPEEPIEGHFVRFTQPVETCEIEKIRGDILAEGALAVEFPNTVTDYREIDPKSSPGNFNSEAYITELEKDMDPRRMEVGQQTREMNYDA
jgi:DNA repair exonuclease SbcCD nuclease subunit